MPPHAEHGQFGFIFFITAPYVWLLTAVAMADASEKVAHSRLVMLSTAVHSCALHMEN